MTPRFKHICSNSVRVGSYGSIQCLYGLTEDGRVFQWREIGNSPPSERSSYPHAWVELKGLEEKT